VRLFHLLLHGLAPPGRADHYIELKGETMAEHALLIANRGEIAVRIAHACAELGIPTVAVHPADDARSLHVKRADRAIEIPGRGPSAYLAADSLIAAAKSAGCTLVHPGYGFLSESAAFAQRCADEGLVFVGPDPQVLSLLGDKTKARSLASACRVPVCRATSAVDAEGARTFFSQLPAGTGMLIKARSGGGGRGMRVVTSAPEIDNAFARASDEALKAFGEGSLYCEELIGNARHIEVQILGDGIGAVTHLGERECTLQRRHQKVMEIAPSPSLTRACRLGIIEAALRMAKEVRYRGLATFEFLVDRDHEDRFFFIEANPRLQVEHTITEELYKVDLVKAQVGVSMGRSLGDLGLEQDRVPAPKGYAIQLRLNTEQMQPDGSAIPAVGTITAYDMPSGRGIRVDGYGYVGYETNPGYDSLLAKVVVHSPEDRFGDAVKKARRAIAETRVSGVPTNQMFLAALLHHPHVLANDVSTRWLDANAKELVRRAADAVDEPLFFGATRATITQTSATAPMVDDGLLGIESPIPGSVVQIHVRVGDPVQAGAEVAVVEAMKMQHAVQAEASGTVREVRARAGDLVKQGTVLVVIEPGDGQREQAAEARGLDLDHIRDDLAAVRKVLAQTLDEARPEAVQKRHDQGGRTARENIADLVDEGSFVEYGQLALPAQRSRLSVDKLRATAPADGVIVGIGTVNAHLFGEERARTFVVAYDYTVLAGTQGVLGHKKQDRLFELAASLQRPVVLFAEGGGGRPGDVDKQFTMVGGLDVATFKAFAQLSGQVPLVGVVHGRCFAGNAVLLGCCDVIIATRQANIGMGGPAMIEGGGLGIYRPEEVGPVSDLAPNGVIDLLVSDEREATAVAKQYLAYFQGTLADWQAADQRALRHVVPENRKRGYDMRLVIDTLADTGSVLELRREFARAMITALVRIEGTAIGVIANDPLHLAGAIDADASDKAARFMQLCNAHGLPLLSLCDTPGFMVGPDVERAAQVRHACRMMVNGAALDVPVVMVVVRRGYGLGAMAMSGGGFHETVLSVSWPTGEFGGMGLEGAVRLAFKKQLEAIADEKARQAQFDALVAASYEHGKAINTASVLEIDNVIDPADTRRSVLAAFRSWNRAGTATARKPRPIDTW
jgi:acetyl/propionyl-CoA carboxylase alpha subunit/acetyl-CoA carboxylase carboxyltransferase component